MNYIDSIEDFTLDIHFNICNKIISYSNKPYNITSFGKDIYLFNGQKKICWFGEYENHTLLVNFEKYKKGNVIDLIKIVIELGTINTTLDISELNDDLTEYNIEFVNLNKYHDYKIHLYLYSTSIMDGNILEYYCDNVAKKIL
jgi:hypothetical protein